MKTRMTIIGLGVVAAVALSSAAYAWSVKEDHGSYQIILCQDQSTATVTKQSNGTWTVTSPGKQGQAGGSFAISGQAAVAACGDGG